MIKQDWFSKLQRIISDIRMYKSDTAYNEHVKKEYTTPEQVARKVRAIDKLATQDANSYIKSLRGNYV